MPHGQYVRQTPDWFIEKMMSGAESAAAAAGALSSVFLYNDSTDGSMLHVWQVYAWAHDAANAAQVGINTVPVNFGPFSKGNASNPVAFQPMYAGQVWYGHAVGFAIRRIFWLSGNQSMLWQASSPLAVLAPGDALFVLSSANNVQVDAAFHWLVMGRNEGYY